MHPQRHCEVPVTGCTLTFPRSHGSRALERDEFWAGCLRKLDRKQFCSKTSQIPRNLLIIMTKPKFSDDVGVRTPSGLQHTCQSL